jgi:hypothetical protein
MIHRGNCSGRLGKERKRSEKREVIGIKMSDERPTDCLAGLLGDPFTVSITSGFGEDCAAICGWRVIPQKKKLN